MIDWFVESSGGIELDDDDEKELEKIGVEFLPPLRIA